MNSPTTMNNSIVHRHTEPVGSGRPSLSAPQMKSGSMNPTLQTPVQSIQAFMPSFFVPPQNAALPGQPALSQALLTRYLMQYQAMMYSPMFLQGVVPSSTQMPIVKAESKSDSEQIHEKQTGEKQFQCSLCPKSYSRKTALMNHALIHNSDKPYKCDYCVKTFRRKCKLKLHIRSHTGERPFPCPTCNKRFSRKCNLKVHLRIHDEKPFACPTCCKRFRREVSLLNHRNSFTCIKRVEGAEEAATPSSPESSSMSSDPAPVSAPSPSTTTVQSHSSSEGTVFQCPHCSLTLSSKGSLTRHFLIHTGEKPHRCEICSERFARSDKLLRHKRQSHGMKIEKAHQLDTSVLGVQGVRPLVRAAVASQ